MKRNIRYIELLLRRETLSARLRSHLQQQLGELQAAGELARAELHRCRLLQQVIAGLQLLPGPQAVVCGLQHLWSEGAAHTAGRLIDGVKRVQL